MAAAESARPECEQKSRHSFHVYCHLYGPVLSIYGSSKFWNEIVPQACSCSASIKHLLIATSNLCQQASKPQEYNIPFLIHYTKALQILSYDSRPDVSIVLIACVLLVICEQLRNREIEAQQHVLAGHKILGMQPHDRASPGGNNVLNEIALTLSRLSSPGPLPDLKSVLGVSNAETIYLSLSHDKGDAAQISRELEHHYG